MNKEDYEVIEFRGHRLLRVPELPQPDRNDRTIGGPACALCVARRNRELCAYMTHRIPHACWMQPRHELPACVFIREDDWQEYVVEFVRRRVSS